MARKLEKVSPEDVVTDEKDGKVQLTFPMATATTGAVRVELSLTFEPSSTTHSSNNNENGGTDKDKDGDDPSRFAPGEESEAEADSDSDSDLYATPEPESARAPAPTPHGTKKPSLAVEEWKTTDLDYLRDERNRTPPTPWPTIAKSLGRTEQECRAKHKELEDDLKPPTGWKWTEEQFRIFKKRDEGLQLQQIAKEMKQPRAEVKKMNDWLWRHKQKEDKKRQHEDLKRGLLMTGPKRKHEKSVGQAEGQNREDEDGDHTGPKEKKRKRGKSVGQTEDESSEDEDEDHPEPKGNADKGGDSEDGPLRRLRR
ncbi:hypothetical protein DM02DRAFT_733569 [Periconia macrospinosa]|uniref:Myb-like domain-containing protein n=1 Tax=Periconia macrospinosa TaxID=97972 RepID=A0A2V1D3T1_9PLEO|nr:hypothetical protein DM02DRAFT_733569 [Periconia macrospinosa]